MNYFITEKDIEKAVKPFYAPILYPTGRKQVAGISREAWESYLDLREMGVPDTKFMRYAKRLQKETGMPYPVCFSMGAILAPWEFFED